MKQRQAKKIRKLIESSGTTTLLWKRYTVSEALANTPGWTTIYDNVSYCESPIAGTMSMFVAFGELQKSMMGSFSMPCYCIGGNDSNYTGRRT